MHTAEEMEARTRLLLNLVCPPILDLVAAAADWEPLDFLAPLDTSRGDERCSTHNLCGRW